MGIIRYQPHSFMQDFRTELDRLFDRTLPSDDQSNVETSHWCPTVDIIEEADKFLIQADIPGVAPEKIEVHMEEGVLTLKGEKKHSHSENKEGFTRQERSIGTFYRRFSLPDTADPESISAKSEHGVLFISIPKKEKGAARQIKVDS